MFCNKCGKEVDANAKFCNHCGAIVNQQQTVNYTNNMNTNYANNMNEYVTIKKKIYQRWWFWLIIIILIIGVIGAAFGGDTENTTIGSSNEKKNSITNVQQNSNTKTNTQQSNKTPEISKSDYQKLCKVYDYKELARNPNKYKGNKVKFTGEVIQVQEGWLNSVTLRVNVTKGEYGFWEDTIWVDYTYKDGNESKILDDDIINIYGEFKGQKTYTTVLGSSISIPQVEAKYISLNSK